MGERCVPSLIVINSTVNKSESKVSLNNNSLPEAICCCLQTCNVAASEKIVGARCVPSLIVINSIINQIESKVSLITTRCLRLFVVVYKHVMLQHQRK